MPIEKRYRCDGCGVEKREANKWWAITVIVDGLRLQPLHRAEALGLTPSTLVLCGQECVQKKVSEFMGASR